MTTTAAEAGRTTRFVQRASPLRGATFSQTLVFGLLGPPQAPLEALAHTAAALGVAMSPQALEQRFMASAAACLHPVLLAAIAQVRTAEPVAMPLLARLTAVYGQERSTILRPEVCAAQWPGCGGSTAASASAARLPGPLPAGALRLADWGSRRLEALAALAPHQVCGLFRLQMQTAVSNATGARQERLTLWETQPPETVALAVALGERQRLAARVLAVRVPQGVADTRRRRWRAAARDTGCQGSATRLALAAWPICVTNGPVERLTGREAVVLGRIRWQIALRFQWWKRHGRVDASRSTQLWRLLWEVYAKLWAMLVQHWSVLVRFWASPDRSLTKAAQTGQQHALPLASALMRVQRWRKALVTVKRCLAAGCRMKRRKKPPNTYQLLL